MFRGWATEVVQIGVQKLIILATVRAMLRNLLQLAALIILKKQMAHHCRTFKRRCVAEI